MTDLKCKGVVFSASYRSRSISSLVKCAAMVHSRLDFPVVTNLRILDVPWKLRDSSRGRLLKTTLIFKQYWYTRQTTEAYPSYITRKWFPKCQIFALVTMHNAIGTTPARCVSCNRFGCPRHLANIFICIVLYSWPSFATAWYLNRQYL